MNEIHWENRWTRDQIKAMLLEQFAAFWQRNTGIERDQLAQVERATDATHAVIISGLRRVSAVRYNRPRRLGDEDCVAGPA